MKFPCGKRSPEFRNKKIFSVLAGIFFFVVLASGGAWCAGAFYFTWDFSGVETICFTLALTGMLIAGFFITRARWMLLVIEAAVLLAFLLQTPERRFASERWNIECRKLPAVGVLKDGKISITDIRDFHYRTPENFTVNYRSDIFDPEKLESMDIIFSYWHWSDLVAHMLLRFNFSDGKSLAVSFEPRVPEGKKGGCFFPGVYRQYGQMMLLSTPGDIIDLRTIYRGEDVYSYRTTAQGAVLKKIFSKIVRQADALEGKNEFYHSIANNCTSGLFNALHEAPELRGFDIRTVFNGLYDRCLFERGFLQCRNGESFASLKSRSFLPGKSSGYNHVIQ